MPEQTPVTIERHAPEHGGPSPAAPAAAGCCCCCCCCLHTIGGLVGAIQGSITGQKPDDRYSPTRDDIDAPFPFRRDAEEEEQPLMPVPMLYWLVVLLMCAATAFATYLYNGANNPSYLLAGGFLAVMILPALQLAASVVTAVIILIFYPSKGEPLSRIGKITLWSFGGTAVGLLAMGGCFALLALR